jgi:hypothetical protein
MELLLEKSHHVLKNDMIDLLFFQSLLLLYLFIFSPSLLVLNLKIKAERQNDVIKMIELSTKSKTNSINWDAQIKQGFSNLLGDIFHFISTKFVVFLMLF